jgi:uncharacterized protein related to proFAR isomerase
MQVIPVIDVRGGVAVAARHGDRARYRPLETPLAASADPISVARGLADLFPFQTLYVADLDGIERGVPDLETQRRLAGAWHGAELWIDDGSSGSEIADVRGAHSRQPPRIGSELHDPKMKSHVLGSESLQSLDDYARARSLAAPQVPLSLDFRGDDFVGPPELLADAALWPERVIVMTLARVGSGEGPDLDRLRDVIARAGSRTVFAAGGVRHAGDLAALRDIGAAGALVATALHQGRITRGDLEGFVS